MHLIDCPSTLNSAFDVELFLQNWQRGKKKYLEFCMANYTPLFTRKRSLILIPEAIGQGSEECTLITPFILA
jgi:hypothetical protein